MEGEEATERNLAEIRQLGGMGKGDRERAGAAEQEREGEEIRRIWRERGDQRRERREGYGIAPVAGQSPESTMEASLSKFPSQISLLILLLSILYRHMELR